MSTEGTRGVPYTLAEAKAVVASHKMDVYHRELMQWLIRQIDSDVIIIHLDAALTEYKQLHGRVDFSVQEFVKILKPTRTVATCELCSEPARVTVPMGMKERSLRCRPHARGCDPKHIKALP